MHWCLFSSTNVSFCLELLWVCRYYICECMFSTVAIVKSRDIYIMKETQKKTAHFEWVKITNKKNIWFQWIAKSNTNNTMASTMRNKKKLFLHKNVWLEKSVHHQFHDNQFMCECIHMYFTRARAWVGEI